MSNIKYLGFAKSSSAVPIFGTSPSSDSGQDIKNEVSKVLGRLKDFQLRPDERQKIKSELGCWYCKKDSRGLLYFSLCNPNYPERHIYAAINQLKDHLNKLGDYQTEPDSTLKLHCREFIEQLVIDFQNLKGFDKIKVVGGMVDDVTSDMRKNTTIIVQNILNTEKLQEKSDRLREKSLLFEQSAEQVQIMSRRRVKIRVLIGMSIVSLILLIVIPIATNTVT